MKTTWPSYPLIGIFADPTRTRKNSINLSWNAIIRLTGQQPGGFGMGRQHRIIVVIPLASFIMANWLADWQIDWRLDWQSHDTAQKRQNSAGL